MKKFLFIVLILGLFATLVAQNVAITDDNSYSPHESAMLDVKSLTKGMLVPRMSSNLRNAIEKPASGLLVFDTDYFSFFYFDGETWKNLSVTNNELFNSDENGVYVMADNLNMGIGTHTANGKLEIQGDGSGGIDELLLVVKNAAGDTVFAVYNGGVRIYVDDNTSKAVGSRGGFAVGGFTSGKGVLSNEYLRISPDSIRFYVDDNVLEKADRGGFAVGGFTSGKTLTNEYLRVTPDSVRVYVSEDSKSTGSRGGFAIGGLTSGKGNESEFMQMTKQNYFIGLGAGASNTSGLYNSFMGYRAGNKNQYGDKNIFLGYEAGFNNMGGLPTSADSVKGDRNIFLGYQAGRANTMGYDNVFLGNQSGKFNSSGNNNILIGVNSGYSMTSGIHNTLIGSSAGFSHTNQSYNVMIGTAAGYHINSLGWDGSFNTFMGINAGYAIQNSRDNTFIGTNAGYWLENGEGNTFLGIDAGRSGDEHHLAYTSNYNTFLGNKSGYNILTGSNNVAIGYYSGFSNTTGSGNVFIGYQAGYSEDGSNKLYIENTNGNASTALIYGEFDANTVRFNAKVGIAGAPDAGASLKVTGDALVTGTFSSNTVSATSLSGNLAGDVVGNINGRVNNLSIEKVFLASTGTIVQIDEGTISLLWDLGHETIQIINEAHADCFYWFRVQRESISEGGTGMVEAGLVQDLFSVPKAMGAFGYEIHFGQGTPINEWCSVWLQFINGSLIGHYIK